jgi:hypothetical protein
MARNVEQKGLDVNRKIVNIGADVHKRSWDVTALVEGAVVMTGSVPPRVRSFPESVYPIPRSHPPGGLRGRARRV